MSDKAVLLSNVAATGSATVWRGGRSALVVSGTLATTNTLQMLADDGATWITVQSVTIAGLQAVLYLPLGQYRFFLNGGSPAGVYAALYTV